MIRTAALILAVVLVASPNPLIGQDDWPRTGAETANFERQTSHEELMQFLYDVQARSKRMLIRELAITDEKRVVPLVILGAPPTGTPGTAWFSGKPTVFITGNVHGDERGGREGGLQLIRALAVGELQPLLERVNVLIMPTLNPDGTEQDSRVNTRGFNLNRDFIAMQTPEIAAVIEGVLTNWWPDVFVDVHNGGTYPYHLTYQTPLHPATDRELEAFARGPLYRGVQRYLASQNMQSFWFGWSEGKGGPAKGPWVWYATEPRARTQRTYGGLQNIITMIYEIPFEWTLREQAANAREGLIGLLRYVADNAPAVRRLVTKARRRTLQQPLPEVVIDMKNAARPEPVQFYIMDGGKPRLVTGQNRMLFLPSSTRSTPWAYAFEGELTDIARFLPRHGIEVERLQAPVTARAERFRLDSIEWGSFGEPPNYTGARVTVSTVPETLELRAGTYIVRMTQNAARLIAELMEPDTKESLVVWHFLDNVLPSAEAFQQRREALFLPFVRIMQPANVRSTLVN